MSEHGGGGASISGGANNKNLLTKTSYFFLFVLLRICKCLFGIYCDIVYGLAGIL